MWAARPHLGSIFEKLLHRKTFYLPAARCLQSCDFDAMFHVKHFEIASRETTRNRFGKAGAHPQLAWESQLPLKPCISLQPLDFKGNCDSSDCFLDFCFVSRCSFNLLRKCGLLAHTSAAFLKNCCTEKLSVACGLLLGNDASRETDFQRPAKGGSTPAFACQRAAIAPLPCLNLHP